MKDYKVPDFSQLGDLVAATRAAKGFIADFPELAEEEWMQMPDDARAFFGGVLVGHMIRKDPRRAFRMLRSMLSDGELPEFS